MTSTLVAAEAVEQQDDPVLGTGRAGVEAHGGVVAREGAGPLLRIMEGGKP